jgi:hypothetical protein
MGANVSTPDKFAPVPGYAAGDRVRVRRGVTDPEYPDLPLGGWAGTVVEVDARSSPTTYRVRWSRETLRHVHPIYERRAERDGFEFGSMWLGNDDLEPDGGGSVSVEPPTSIITKPLSLTDQDDRIRAVFGLTSDDLVPDVSPTTLRAYHEHLLRHLPVPVEARYDPEHGPGGPVTVLGLSGPDEDVWADGTCGLLCRAKLKGEVLEVPLADCRVKAGGPARQLLADYGYWFGNFG